MSEPQRISLREAQNLVRLIAEATEERLKAERLQEAKRLMAYWEEEDDNDTKGRN